MKPSGKSSSVVYPENKNAGMATIVKHKSSLQGGGRTGNGRLREKCAKFMQRIEVEVASLVIVLLYGVLVLFEMLLPEERLDQYRREFEMIDLILATILAIELAIKLYAFGLVYLKNYWNVFDAVVVVLSVVLGIVQTFGTESLLLIGFLRIRVLLRAFRILMVVERIKQRAVVVNAIRRRHVMTAPIERVLLDLYEIRGLQSLLPDYKDKITFAIETLKSNRLYETNEDLIASDVDDETAKWLKDEMVKSKRTALSNRAHEATRRGLLKLRTISIASQKDRLRRSNSERAMIPLSTASEHEICRLMENGTSWNFNVFEIDRLSDGQALSVVGMYILRDHFLVEALGVETQTCSLFLKAIQQGYVNTNPYHNALHAADVLQTMNYFITREEIHGELGPLDKVASVIGAAIHDFKHDGFNNPFHINTRGKLAIRYNDKSPQENFHISEAFQLINSHTGAMNIFANLADEDYKYVRNLIIEMVLATDMSVHFEKVALFKAKITGAENSSEDGRFHLVDDSDKQLLLKFALHTADVSNPAKKIPCMLRWTDLVSEEFFRQGDKERELGLPVSPFMDRGNPSLSKQQVGFIEFIVQPMFELWAQVLADVGTDGLKQIVENKNFWKELGDSVKPSDLKAMIEEEDRKDVKLALEHELEEELEKDLENTELE